MASPRPPWPPWTWACRASGESLRKALTDKGITPTTLVNNAGFGTHGRFRDEDPARVASEIALNVSALVDLTHAFLPNLTGALINIASTAAYQPTPNMAVYGATKAFVLNFTEALAYSTALIRYVYAITTFDSLRIARDGAHHRRREGLRLRHRQRRLDDAAIAPIVVWSPDSKKIATFQQDQRGVGEMYLVDTKVGHPTLQAWKYPLPGDRRRHDDPARRSSTSTSREGRPPADAARPAPLDALRRHRLPRRRVGATCSGAPTARTSRSSRRRAITSTSSCASPTRRPARSATSSRRRSPTFFESGNGRVNWRYLPASNEVIWFSERDNWGQLYLYDLRRPASSKNQITTGEGNVTQLLRVDEKTRAAVFRRRRPGEGPRSVLPPLLSRSASTARTSTLLTPEDADHDVTLSPSGKYFVDSYSKPDVPPVAVLRDADGKLLVTLEKADISRLLATGWKPPMPITVKARDGATDLYGLMFKPTNLDPTKKYPIVNHIYPGPADRQRRRPHVSPRRAAMRRRSPSSASSSSRSTAWARRGDRRSSTRRTTATWATTRCPIRSPG